MKYHVAFDAEFKRNTHPGKFIVIEGIDGSGKTTQAHRVVEALRAKGMEAVFTKEPTDSLIGQLIRKILAGDAEVAKVSLQYLFSSDRGEHEKEIIQYLRNNTMVIADRYFWSSVAYGIVDTGEENDYYLTALSILSYYHKFLVPDYTFYLDVSIDTALSRLSKMSKTKEIYENREKLLSIKKGYDFLVEKFAKEFTIIDGEQPVEKVTKTIIQNL